MTVDSVGDFNADANNDRERVFISEVLLNLPMRVPGTRSTNLFDQVPDRLCQMRNVDHPHHVSTGIEL